MDALLPTTKLPSTTVATHMGATLCETPGRWHDRREDGPAHTAIALLGRRDET